MDCKIKQITEGNYTCLSSLVKDRTAIDFSFVKSAFDEWISGKNRFDRKGEILLGVFAGDECAGICGLNIDPYAEDLRLGRVRHLFICEAYRRQGLGQQLLTSIIEQASENFDRIRLYTDSKAAAALYEKTGFRKSFRFKESHIMDLKV